MSREDGWTAVLRTPHSRGLLVAGAVVSSAAYAAGMAWPGALVGSAGVVLLIVGTSSPLLEEGLQALYGHMMPVRQLPVADALDSADMQAAPARRTLVVRRAATTTDRAAERNDSSRRDER